MRDQGSKRWFCLEEMKKKIEGKGGRKWHVKCRAVLRHSSNIKVSVGRGGKDRFVSNASRLEVMKIKLLAASSKTQNI